MTPFALGKLRNPFPCYVVRLTSCVGLPYTVRPNLLLIQVYVNKSGYKFFATASLRDHFVKRCGSTGSQSPADALSGDGPTEKKEEGA